MCDSFFQISLKIALFMIDSFDGQTGHLTASGSITSIWNDNRLLWNKTNFGKVTRIHVSADEIWFPDIQHIVEGDGNSFNPSMWLHNNGTVYGIFSGSFNFRCNFDFFYYPFDQQLCFTSLYDPGYDDSQINFTLIQRLIDINTFTKHGIWDIVDTNARVFRYQQSDLQIAFVGCSFKLELKRRSGLTIMYTSVPISAVLCLNVIVYCVPVQSGERVSFSITVLLAFIFFSASSPDTIPESAVTIPIIAFINAGCVCLCTLNVILSVVLTGISLKYTKHVPHGLQAFIRVCHRCKPVTHNKSEESLEDMETSLNTSVSPVRQYVYDQCKTTDQVKTSGVDNITWKMVVDVFDGILFYFQLGVIVIINLIVALVLNKN